MDSERLKKQYKGEDIISRLPDDVLSHIISRLEAKDAVKTCVLSSRWKNVWTLIYNFCFNSWSIEEWKNGNERNRGTLFVNFVELVLRRSQSKSIKKFHLNTHYDFQEIDTARLIELICFAVDRNVCSLTIKFGILEKRPVIRLHESILTCKSLVKLSLGVLDFPLDIPDCEVCFPCLKFLSINVNRQNSNSLQKLFRSCPILEELKIKGWRVMDGNMLTVDINVPTLKKLKINLLFDYDDIWVRRFVVRARNLEYLHVRNGVVACSVLGEIPFLNKVIIDHIDNVVVLYGSPNDEATARATEFFRAISSTRFLSLDVIVMPELSGDLYDNLPSFPNLNYLYLGVEIYIGFALLVQFLNNSPNLEVLVLDMVEEGWYNKRFELECVPSCMLLHLKEIYLFSVDIYLEGVIKCLLENSKVLEKFSIHVSSRRGKQEIQNRILNFPRASPICEIEFVQFYSCKKKLQSKFRKYR